LALRRRVTFLSVIMRVKLQRTSRNDRRQDQGRGGGAEKTGPATESRDRMVAAARSIFARAGRRQIERQRTACPE